MVICSLHYMSSVQLKGIVFHKPFLLRIDRLWHYTYSGNCLYVQILHVAFLSSKGQRGNRLLVKIIIIIIMLVGIFFPQSERENACMLFSDISATSSREHG